MIDAENLGILNLGQVNEIFRNTIKGIYRIMGKKMSDTKEINLIAFKAFTSADADNDNDLEMNEVINWIELNDHFLKFLNKYESSTNVEYSDCIFEKFPPIDICNLESKLLDTLQDLTKIGKHTESSARKLGKSSE